MVTAAVLIVLAGLYSVAMVGVTGGPNNGEHPFIVTILHMAVFGWRGQHWPPTSRHLYWVGLAIALLCSIIAMRNTPDPGGKYAGWQWFSRIGILLAYVGLMLVFFKRP